MTPFYVNYYYKTLDGVRYSICVTCYIHVDLFTGHIYLADNSISIVIIFAHQIFLS